MTQSSSTDAAAQPAFLAAPVRAVLFDLDGTLVDTVGDIAASLQSAFAAHDLPPPSLAAVRTMIGRGAPILVERALAAAGVASGAARQAAVLESFFERYGRLQQRGDGSATVYPGVASALRVLHARGLPLAVVTNKQHAFAQALLARLGLAPLLALVVGGDTCERRKPDPQPVLHALSVLGVAPAHAVMVGDSVNDLGAARAAGVRAIGVPYGYNEGRDPRELACDALIESMDRLPALLGIDGAAAQGGAAEPVIPAGAAR